MPLMSFLGLSSSFSNKWLCSRSDKSVNWPQKATGLNNVEWLLWPFRTASSAAFLIGVIISE